MRLTGGTKSPSMLRRHESGFTLTELLVAMALTGVVMASLYSAHLTQQRAYRVTENVTAVQQSLRSAMYFLEKDIRMAGYDPREAGGFGFSNITSHSQTSVRFTLDQNENGALDPDDYIEYQYNAAGKTLRRKLGADVFRTIASDISSTSFTFFTASGVTTTIPTAIRSVGINIQGSRETHIRSLQSRVVCRNMGL